MTVIYTDSEAIDNARSNLIWWGVTGSVVECASEQRLIELLKMRQAQFNTDGISYAIAVTLLRDLERP